MKAEQKEQLYQILKKTSGAILGYTSNNFAAAPQFQDDVEPAEPAQTASPAQTAAPLSPNSSQAQEAAPVQQPDASEQISAGATIESVAQKIASCARCPLCKTRKNVVPGEGVANPLVLVVGEGPCADEDEQGRPFVGKAGQLLDKMLAAINLSRDKNCFIANIVKCRPPLNRDPSPEESQACRSFLDAQIHVLKPKMILAMGRVALQNLLDTSIGINKMRGQFVDFKGIPFMATYHPSALLRDESLKRPAWEDLKAFKNKLLEICPDYDK
ncbi:MAG: uracil-DNA glycosylase [Treponema sp.]|nr:uracil-DNA glycosylase [Treponema sp.]